MTVETGTYINSLNASYPPETDALSEIDEHLKIIKSTIKATFPNVDAAVTATPAELNKSTALVSDGTNVTFNTGITAAKIKTLVGIIEPAITTSTDGAGEVTPVLATGITGLEMWNLVKLAALDSIYPVGAIYTSIVSTILPGVLFGGTWESFGQGRVLVGHDDAESPDSDFVASSTDGSSVLVGGAKTHTLTTDELPGHTHNVAYDNEPNIEKQGGGGYDISELDGTTLTRATSSTGGGGAHNNIQPYVVVYMWKRTA
jgi:hypothetical protein